MKITNRINKVSWLTPLSGISIFFFFLFISACNKKQDFSESQANEWPVYLGDKQNSNY